MGMVRETITISSYCPYDRAKTNEFVLGIERSDYLRLSDS
jgi:hypothetical protein